ncbi:MAG: hypothetical protein AAF265_10770, partial [Pseudomonadota bacterium]
YRKRRKGRFASCAPLGAEAPRARPPAAQVSLTAAKAVLSAGAPLALLSYERVVDIVPEAA